MHLHCLDNELNTLWDMLFVLQLIYIYNACAFWYLQLLRQYNYRQCIRK